MAGLKKVALMMQQKHGVCSKCGGVNLAVQPFGENAADICFLCAMKSPEHTDRMMTEFINCLLDVALEAALAEAVLIDKEKEEKKPN